MVGVDTLVPLSAPAGNGVARWRLHGGEPVKYLAYSAQSGLGRIVAAQWGAKDRAFALETVFTSHLAATLLSMARAGDGVAWLPRTLAEEDISAGLLVEAGDPELRYQSKSGCFARSHVKARRSKRSGRPLNGVDVHSSWCARPGMTIRHRHFHLNRSMLALELR